MKKEGFDALFALKRMCSNCPFRKVGAIELRQGRLEGIVEHLLADDWATFSCHKTTNGEWLEEGDDDAEYVSSGEEAHCMGAMAYLQRAGMQSVPMRIGYATNLLKMDLVARCAEQVIEPMPGHQRD